MIKILYMILVLILMIAGIYIGGLQKTWQLLNSSTFSFITAFIFAMFVFYIGYLIIDWINELPDIWKK